MLTRFLERLLLALLCGNLVYNTDLYFIKMNVIQHPTSDQSGFEQNMLIVELMVVLDEEVLLKDHNTQLEKDVAV